MRCTAALALATLVVGHGALTSATPAAAQLATPTAASPVAGGACTLAPRPVDDLVALWFDPTGAPRATPSPPDASLLLAPGKPADAATVAGIDATLVEIDACLTTGQFARAFSLYTDNHIRQSAPDMTNPETASAEQVRRLLTNQLTTTPAAGAAPAVLEIHIPDEARVLPDGRVGSFFADPSGVYFGIFARKGDRWLLDGVIAVGVESGTPTP